MKLSCIQFEPILGRFDENLRKMQDLISSTDAKILVFPELATSGYFFQTKKEALACAESAALERSGGVITNALKKSGASATIYGFPEKKDGKLYNSVGVVTPTGVECVYRKIHLFNTELEIFEPGDEGFKVVDISGVRLGLMICFDWIFPESARTLALMGADVICHAANLVLPWCQQAMITRSIENKIFTATANRVGSESGGGAKVSFSGMSQITSPKGEILVRASKGGEEIITAEFDPAEARDKRLNKYNDIMGDRRPEFYKWS